MYKLKVTCYIFFYLHSFQIKFHRYNLIHMQSVASNGKAEISHKSLELRKNLLLRKVFNKDENRCMVYIAIPFFHIKVQRNLREELHFFK